MSHITLPFETWVYDDLPISTFVYEAILNEDGSLKDYRVVYANRVFARDWNAIYHNDNYIGAYLMESTLMDDYSLSMMDRFRTETPHSFSTYMPMVNLHLHFEPMVNLPAPYAGFFLTNITDYEEQESKTHFLRNIDQMQNNSVLMQQHEDGRLESVYVSEAFARMMECTVKEAMEMMDGIGFLKSTHPEDRPFVRSMLKRRVGDDGTSDLTIQKLTAKKKRIWCSVHYAFIDDFSEHYIYCTYANVTVLKSYEERLRSVYVNLGSNFYQTNEKTLALSRVNLTRDVIEESQGQDMLKADAARYPYSEAIERRLSHFPIKEEQERFRKTFDRKRLSDGYLEGKVTASEMLYSKRNDGSCCFVNVTATMTRHPLTGDMIAFITEEECNAEKVRETLMNTILSQQFDMVAYLVDGSYGVSIGDANRIRQGNIFPTTQKGIYQQYVENQVLPVLEGDKEYHDRIKQLLSLEAIETHTKTDTPYVVDIAISIDGETYNKRFDFYSVNPEAKFYIVLKSDTTELTREQTARNEQLRVALEEAKQANVAKTAFLSSMSHEIRTPMNAIIGIDNIALRDETLQPHTREQFEKIGVSARHLLGLINDILDMSRIESGRMVLKNEEFSFRGFLEQINTLVSSQCQDKGLAYDCKLQGQVDEYYIGDDMKLKQVLINILGNAVKFTPAPGTVSFIVEQTARFEDKVTLRFIMKDTGIGMDEEYIPKIFEAFSQEDATSTNKYGGSGLGMAITKNIVEMMNGNITVTSKKGEGSEFTVNVTLRSSDRTDSHQLSEVRPQDLSVLIIDDDPLDCEHAKLVLEEIGIASDIATSGKEALEMMQLRHARRTPYNLILVDLRMPDQDGIEVTRQIRELYNGESTIVILTAYSWTEVEEEAVHAGVDSFMAKPLFASNVLYEFQQVISRRKLTHREEKKEVELKGRRILLAEDMAINAEIIMMILQMSEMEVEHAENGQIAVEMFTHKPPRYYDAILMDMRMPVMDGLEATESIRASEHPDSKRIPIIALTANAFDEDVQRSLQAGMNAHLSKPVEPDKLTATLQGLISDED
ncbi:MAG: response regulator [Lachnospiraceae bacterium]|nr:response regulator [Lachnospiraceae bacterium]